jgi:hypothetical protein
MAAAMDPAAWVALIMLHVLDVKTMTQAVYGGSDRAALIRVKAEKKGGVAARQLQCCNSSGGGVAARQPAEENS